jgi:16S rRNA (cytosine967-C5)-methyltransferase
LDTPRNLALLVLNKQAHKFITVDTCLDEIFRQNPNLNRRDRAFLVHLVQGVLRWQRRLDWIIEQSSDFPIKKITPPVLNILRLALYQIYFMDRVPESAAVNEAVNQAKKNGARYIVSFVNGILRNICKKKDDVDFPDPDENPVLFFSVFYAYPEWLVDKWFKEWGSEFTEALLSAENRVPELTIRVNRLRLGRTALIKRLSEEGVHGRRTDYSPDGILLENFKGRVDELESFRKGLFQVQDEAAQITSHILNPKQGQIILDTCAGLGGKSTHLAEFMADNGQVMALDISLKRLVSLVKNLKRLSIKSIQPIVADASGSLSSLLRLKFDGIVVDAPCSGLGVLSRHPDGKWNRTEGDVRRLAIVQETILNEVASLLKTGGKMLYVTCTISKEENEEVVKRCLAENRDLQLENIKDHVPEWGHDLVDNEGFLRTFPHEHHMDGFFSALFIKKE